MRADKPPPIPDICELKANRNGEGQPRRNQATKSHGYTANRHGCPNPSSLLEGGFSMSEALSGKEAYSLKLTDNPDVMSIHEMLSSFRSASA